MKNFFSYCAAMAMFLDFGVSASADETLIPVATNETTVALVRLEAKNSELSPNLETMANSMASTEIVQLFAKPFEMIRRELGESTGYATFDLPYGVNMNGRIAAKDTVTAEQLEKIAMTMWPYESAVSQRIGVWNRIQLSTSKPMSDSALASLSPAQPDAWSAAMQETADYPMQLIVVVPEVVKKTIAETDPELPTFLGGGPARELLGGLNWISIGIHPKNVTFRAVL
ncbi:MAG: hypothetical protein AAGG44_14530, partial [Planctomycetota bacterium]